MLEMLATYGYYGGEGAIGGFLDTLAQAGFFTYLLPFLIIFALVYGILLKIEVFKKSKAVNAILALSVALMALQFNIVPAFFAEVFPRVGIGLAIILVVLIMMGLFLPSAPWVPYVLWAISAIIVVVILVQTGGYFGGEIGYWFYDNWPLVLAAVFVIAVIAVVMGAGGEKKETKVPVPFFPWTAEKA